MPNDWDKIMKRYGIIAGIVGLLGLGGYLSGLKPVFAYQLEEVRQLAQSNSNTLALQRWQYLDAKKRNQGLDAGEQFEYCKLSKQLGLLGIGCA